MKRKFRELNNKPFFVPPRAFTQGYFLLYDLKSPVVVACPTFCNYDSILAMKLQSKHTHSELDLVMYLELFKIHYVVSFLNVGRLIDKLDMKLVCPPRTWTVIRIVEFQFHDTFYLSKCTNIFFQPTWPISPLDHLITVIIM